MYVFRKRDRNQFVTGYDRHGKLTFTSLEDNYSPQPGKLLIPNAAIKFNLVSDSFTFLQQIGHKQGLSETACITESLVL